MCPPKQQDNINEDLVDMDERMLALKSVLKSKFGDQVPKHLLVLVCERERGGGVCACMRACVYVLCMHA